MNKLKKNKRKAFIVAMVMTFMLAGGIPMIPVGFSMGLTVIGVIGIVFAAVGFYGCPISWVMFGNYFPLQRVLYAVENESLYSVSDIATYLRKGEKEVSALLGQAIDKLYLEGYLFDGKVLTLNSNKKLKKNVIPHKCPSCGAPLPEPADGAKFIKCPYCDTIINL